MLNRPMISPILDYFTSAPPVPPTLQMYSPICLGRATLLPKMEAYSLCQIIKNRFVAEVQTKVHCGTNLCDTG